MAKTISSILISGFSCIFLLVEVVYLVAVLVEKFWRTKYQSEMIINPDVWKESKFSVKFRKLFLNDLFLQRVLVLVCAITHSLITLSTAQLSDQSVSRCLLWNMTSTVLFTVGKYSMFLFLYGKQRVLKDRLQDKVSREEKVIFALIHLLPVVGFLIAITRKYALSDYVCTVTTPFGALGLLALAAMLYLAISLHLLNLFLEVISKNITKRSSKRRASSKSPSKKRKGSAAKRKSSGGDSVGFRDSQDSSVHKSAEGLALDIHPAPNVSSESLQQPSPSTVVQERVISTQSSRRSSVAVNLANLESSGIIIPKTALRQPHFDLMELNKESCLISIVSFLVVVFIGAVMTRINAHVIAHSVELILNNGNLLIDSFAMMMCSPQVWFVFSGLLKGNKIGGDGQKSPDPSVGLSDRRISASLGNVSGELAGVHLSNPVQAMTTPKASHSKKANAA